MDPIRFETQFQISSYFVGIIAGFFIYRTTTGKINSFSNLQRVLIFIGWIITISMLSWLIHRETYWLTNSQILNFFIRLLNSSKLSNLGELKTFQTEVGDYICYSN
jgi:hypothetical protein